MGARSYDPTTNRFAQPDPSGKKTNPYLYTADDPIYRMDPTRLYEVTADLAATLVAGAAGVAVGGATGNPTAGAAAGGCAGGVLNVSRSTDRREPAGRSPADRDPPADHQVDAGRDDEPR
ncbi:RHS repeat-associated core domain-containing protein [Streptomyces sp. SAS_276]